MLWINVPQLSFFFFFLSITYFVSLFLKNSQYPWFNNSQDTEATYISISRRMDKKAVVHIHNGIFSSVQFSRSVVSDSFWPHELQHARPPCPSPSSRVHSNSRPSSRWCHPAISSSVVPFSSCPQSLPASGSFPMSQLFAWGGQSTGVSALASFLPKKSQGWSLSEWTGWTSLLVF